MNTVGWLQTEVAISTNSPFLLQMSLMAFHRVICPPGAAFSGNQWAALKWGEARKCHSVIAAWIQPIYNTFLFKYKLFGNN